MIIPTLSNVPRPRAAGYDGYIDEVLIRLAVTPETPFQDLTAEVTPPRIDTSESAEDMREEFGRRYSRSRLSGGAGLDFLHTPERGDDARVRYWDSRRVDVFRELKGSTYEVTLMHEMVGESITGTVLGVFEHDDNLYFLKADGIYDLSTGSQVIALTSATKAVSMGASIYVLDGSGVGKITPPTWTRSAHSAVAYTNIWSAKSRIIGIDGNVLKDASNSDAAVLTVPVGDTVYDVCDAGPAVLALSSTGSIHSLALDDSLALLPVAETSFTNEYPVLCAEAFGTLGFVTAEATEAGGYVARFYTGQLSQDYSVGAIQLQYQVGDRETSEDLTPLAMTATRDSIYAAIPNEGEDVLTLWRYYLPSGGYARAHEIDFTGASLCPDLVEVDERMYVATDIDVFVEANTYEADGWIIGPAADFYTSENKQWVSADLTGGVLPVGCALELFDALTPEAMSSPAGNWSLVARLSVGSSESRANSLPQRESRFHVAKVVLVSPQDRSDTPAFRSYSFRGLPNQKRDILLRVPINVSDQIESQGRRATRIPGRGEAIESLLRTFEGKHTIIELFRPSWKIRGMVEQFESTIQTVPARGAVRAVMYARIRGTEVSDLGESAVNTSNASWGQDMFTAGQFAIGEVNQ